MKRSTPDESVREQLLGVKKSEYGEAYRGHVLEIYGRVVEMADRVSQRRQSANSFFLSLNSALVAFVG